MDDRFKTILVYNQPLSQLSHLSFWAGK